MLPHVLAWERLPKDGVTMHDVFSGAHVGSGLHSHSHRNGFGRANIDLSQHPTPSRLTGKSILTARTLPFPQTTSTPLLRPCTRRDEHGRPALPTLPSSLQTPSLSFALSTARCTHNSSQTSYTSTSHAQTILREQLRQYVLQQHRHRQQAGRSLHSEEHPGPIPQGEGRGPRQLRQQVQILHDDHQDE